MSAENNFVGAPTGGMDQLAALHGKNGNVLFCDMRTLAVTPIPFDLTAAGLSLLAIDTGISHSHAGGEYGARRAGCEQAAETLGVRALRDVTDLGAALAMLPDGPLRGYVRHVVTENGRVLRTAELLSSGAVRQIGPLRNASHAASDAIRQKLRETDRQVARHPLDPLTAEEIELARAKLWRMPIDSPRFCCALAWAATCAAVQHKTGVRQRPNAVKPGFHAASVRVRRWCPGRRVTYAPRVTPVRLRLGAYPGPG